MNVNMMSADIKKVLITEHQIQEKVAELGAIISKDYQGKNPILISILKGGVVFLADLMRKITIPIEIEFLGISSYGKSTKSSGVVKIVKDLNIDIRGRHVLIIEDIVDTGLSLTYIKNMLIARNPQSLKICALLDKYEARVQEIFIDYPGFQISNEFVVGYGLDYAEKYRNLSYIGVLKPEYYKQKGDYNLK